MIHKFVLYSLAFSIISACATNPTADPITNREQLAPIIGKNLTLNKALVVVNEDGTLSGSNGVDKLAGTWEFSDGYWCRTMTEGPKRLLKNPTDCQVLRIEANKLYVSRKKGTGKTLIYSIGE